MVDYRIPLLTTLTVSLCILAAALLAPNDATWAIGVILLGLMAFLLFELAFRTAGE